MFMISMRSKDLLVGLVLVLIVFCSLNLISANEISDVDGFGVSENDLNEISDVDGFGVSENDLSDNNYLNEGLGENQNLNNFPDNSKEIYVGYHNTTYGGNGTENNPFTTFKAACDSVNGEDTVTIKVFSGTYYLGKGFEADANTPLRFNTNNLNIIGINGSVIIKNYFNDDYGYNAEVFELTSTSANLTMSNLIFDGSNVEAYYYRV